MKKKIDLLKIPLTLILLFLTILPAVADELKTIEIDGLLYQLINSDEARVSGYTYVGSKWNCVIPSSIDWDGETYSVTTINTGAFMGCINLTSVTIPNSVTAIGVFAFYGCSNLTSVTIPNSVTTIGGAAFKDCSNLTSVTIPNSVTTIGESAFQNCSNLTSVTIPNSVTAIGNQAFDNTQITKVYFDAENCTYIGTKGLAFPESLESVTFGNNVKNIPMGAFRSCSRLTSVSIPNSVTSIEDQAFKNCSNLSEIIIGDLDTPRAPSMHVGQAFSGCPISRITFGYIVKEIDYLGFSNGMSDLTKFEIANFDLWTKNNKSIQLAAADTLRILSGSMKSECLKNFSNLKSLTVPCLSGTVDSPDNLGELFGSSQFSGTRAVVQYFEDGSSKTYYIPTSLEELTISEGCGILPFGGLSNCNMLKKVTLPTSVYLVGEKAFFGCASVTDVYCQSADPAVAFNNSFDGMRLSSCKLHVPYNSADLYKAAEGWKRFYYIQEEAPIVVHAIPNILNAGVILGLEEYRAGQTANLRAVANSGYTFDGWYENGLLLTSEDTYSFTVTGSREISVIFTPISGSGPVTVIPEGTDITLEWPPVEGASSYDVTIYSDSEMRNPVASVTLDGKSAESTRHNVPGHLSASFDNLSEQTDYYYSISAFNTQNATLSRYDGSFTTGYSSVDGVTDGGVSISGYYNLHGVRSDNPWDGVNIVIYSDGSVKKLIRH